jgi:hypothetical protein
MHLICPTAPVNIFAGSAGHATIRRRADLPVGQLERITGRADRQPGAPTAMRDWYRLFELDLWIQRVGYALVTGSERWQISETWCARSGGMAANHIGLLTTCAGEFSLAQPVLPFF